MLSKWWEHHDACWLPPEQVPRQNSHLSSSGTSSFTQLTHAQADDINETETVPAETRASTNSQFTAGPGVCWFP